MFINHLNLSHIRISEFQPKEKSDENNDSHTENSQLADPSMDNFKEDSESAFLENQVSFGQSLKNNIGSYYDTVKSVYSKIFNPASQSLENREVISDPEKANSLSSIMTPVKVVDPPMEIVDLPLIEKKRVSLGSSVLNKIKSLYHKIRNLFVLNVIVRPKLNKFISKQLKEIKPQNYKSNYPTLLDSTYQFMNELKEKLNITSSFGDERDLQRFQLKLVNRVNKILNKNKIPSISKEEFKTQSIEFKLRTLVKEKSIPSELSKLLASIEPEDMPIDLLSKIEFNSENEGILIDTWKRLIENLPKIGFLDRLNTHKLRSEAPLRITCAIKLLEAIKYAPKSKNSELDQLLETYSKKTSHLEDFIVHENSLLKVPVKLNCLKLLAKQEEYTASIKPHIEKFVQKLKSGVHARDLILVLANKETCQEIQSTLVKEKELAFSLQSIDHMLIKELEILAVEEFKLTDTQLKNLRNQREQIRENGDDKLLSVDALIFSEDVTRKIIKKGYNHPSEIPDKALLALFKLTSLKSKPDLSEDEKQEYIEALQTLLTVPNILELLKKFKKPVKVGLKNALEKNEASLQETLGIFHSIYKKVNPLKLEDYFKIPAGININTIKKVRKFFESREMLPELEKYILKAQALLIKYQNNPEEISQSEQLSLKEMGKIFAFTAFEGDLDEYKKLGIELHPIVNKLIKACDEACAIKKEFEKILIPAMRERYHSGDMFIYKGTHKAQWIGGTLIGLDKLNTKFCGEYTHTMKAIHDQEGELDASEIAGVYKRPKMRIYDVAISDMYRLNFGKLIPKSSKVKLKEVLGEKWKEIVKEEYIKIEENINRVKSQNYEIVNPGNKRAYAGMSSWKRFFSLVKPLTGLQVPGHRLESEQDFRKIYEKFMNGEKIKEELMCSEFTAKTTIVTIMELNKVIQQLIIQKNPELQASKIHEKLKEKNVKISKNVENYLNGKRHFGLKRHVTKKAERDLIRLLRKQGFSKNTIEFMIRLNNEEMIDLPFDRKERLETLHPSRMVKLLKDKKYVTQIALPKEFQSLINFSDL